MVSKLLRLIIMGPPGSGKGTISSRIVKDFELKHLSSGDLLRSQIAGKTDAGLDAKSYIDQGRLVPDETMIALILNELRGMRSSSWLLDGFPRTIAQAKSLHSAEPADAVVNLDVPFPVIINRIKGRWTHAASGRIYHTEFNPPQKSGVDDITGEALIQRDDDREEVVTKRLETYQSLTEPVLQFYRDLGLLQEFKGKYSNEIWPRVHQYLSTIATPLQYTEYK